MLRFSTAQHDGAQSLSQPWRLRFMREDSKSAGASVNMPSRENDSRVSEMLQDQDGSLARRDKFWRVRSRKANLSPPREMTIGLSTGIERMNRTFRCSPMHYGAIDTATAFENTVVPLDSSKRLTRSVYCPGPLIW